MIENQYSVSINRLFKIRSKFSQVIEKIDDQYQRKFYKDLLDLLIFELTPEYEDIQKKGIYKTLLLGANNQSIINNFAGVNASALSSNENSYLISIERTFREQSLTIEFSSSSSLSEESKRIIRSVFLKKSPQTNIERYLGNSQIPIPSLRIDNLDLSFLESFDDDINLLKSTNSIKKIKVKLCFLSDVNSNQNIFSLCHRLDIIPTGYNVNNLDMYNLKSQFNELDTSELYNFVILNDKNDFLIKVFFDLIIEYKDKLDIVNQPFTKIIERIFYINENDILNQTRFFQEKPDYKENTKNISFNKDINYRHEYLAILFVLNYLQYFFLKNTSIPTAIYARTLKQINHNRNQLFTYLKSLVKTNTLSKPEIVKFKQTFTFIKDEIKSLLYTTFNYRNTQDILFELSNVISHEILCLMAEIQEDKT